MATIIAGGGNRFYTTRGVAPAGTISSPAFDVLLPGSGAELAVTWKVLPRI